MLPRKSLTFVFFSPATSEKRHTGAAESFLQGENKAANCSFGHNHIKWGRISMLFVRFHTENVTFFWPCPLSVSKSCVKPLKNTHFLPPVLLGLWRVTEPVLRNGSNDFFLFSNHTQKLNPLPNIGNGGKNRAHLSRGVASCTCLWLGFTRTYKCPPTCFCKSDV